MGSSEFLRFNPNFNYSLSQADYNSSATRQNGFVDGMAETALFNKYFAQSSTMIAAIGQALADAGKVASDADYLALIAAIKEVFGAKPLPPGYIVGRPPAYTNSNSITIRQGLKVRSSDNTLDIEVPGNIILSLAASGANGLDTGAEAPSTWYYPYAIADSTAVNPVAGLFSATDWRTIGSVTLPSGYDKIAPLYCPVRNDGSSNIIPFYLGEWGLRNTIIYQVTGPIEGVAGTNSVISNGTSLTYAGISLINFVPPVSKEAYLAVMNNGTNRTVFRATGDSSSGYGISGGNGYGLGWVPTNASQSMDYKQVISTSGGVYVGVAGFRVTEF